MNAYYFVSRLASPVVRAGFYFYSLLVHTPRARVVVKNEDGEILLVQTWPDTSVWSLPGGGVHRGEQPEESAARELREETGIEVSPDAIRPIGVFKRHGHDELVHSVTVPKDRLPPVTPNRWEIRRAEWFSPDSLPNVTPTVRYVLTKVVSDR